MIRVPRDLQDELSEIARWNDVILGGVNLESSSVFFCENRPLQTTLSTYAAIHWLPWNRSKRIIANKGT